MKLIICAFAPIVPEAKVYITMRVHDSHRMAPLARAGEGNPRTACERRNRGLWGSNSNTGKTVAPVATGGNGSITGTGGVATVGGNGGGLGGITATGGVAAKGGNGGVTDWGALRAAVVRRQSVALPGLGGTTGKRWCGDNRWLHGIGRHYQHRWPYRRRVVAQRVSRTGGLRRSPATRCLMHHKNLNRDGLYIQPSLPKRRWANPQG